ncbi:hypothetical protein QBC32DRAFT_147041 [Pseudoneurospora amorphoporcata]|uniref:Rpr2-domain-containing protein n=1 Tax=Pseudoneurospora amorphoporcata TaxID=241081 RepID=A0AAN6SFW6_9PEZI|nr:hypothetical protein QBC32DRAFT_147041 [Pseudoneurospora amorphoporcata]
MNGPSSTELSATLDFLTDAAHLLATTAPETSAFLMNQRGNLMFENELSQSDVQRQHVCSCCGHIMIPGQGSTLKFEHQKAVRKRTKAGQKFIKTPVQTKRQIHLPEPRKGPVKRITCGHCEKQTEIKFPAPPPISRRSINLRTQLQQQQQQQQAPKTTATGLKPNTAPILGSLGGLSAQKPTSSSSANSKKRAKSRKAGLQALLDQSSNSSKASRPGLGLSLADFMQK